MRYATTSTGRAHSHEKRVKFTYISIYIDIYKLSFIAKMYNGPIIIKVLAKALTLLSTQGCDRLLEMRNYERKA